MGDPKSLSRGAVERVLARAAQLQAGTGDNPRTDALSESQLIEIGKEVGLSPEHLRQAMAEERAHGEPTAERVTLMESFVGRRRITAERTVMGDPDSVLAALDRWLQNEEWLRVKRQRADHMVWEPRRDFLGGLRRAFAGRKHSLHAATDVSASVAGVDAVRSVVVLSADLGAAQNTYIAQATTGLLVGAAATGVLLVLSFMTAIAVAPIALIGLGSVYGARRAMERSVEHAQTALEQALDRLERRTVDTRPPSLLQMIDSALPRLR
jgi:hypothetical protein